MHLQQLAQPRQPHERQSREHKSLGTPQRVDLQKALRRAVLVERQHPETRENIPILKEEFVTHKVTEVGKIHCFLGHEAAAADRQAQITARPRVKILQD